MPRTSSFTGIEDIDLLLLDTLGKPDLADEEMFAKLRKLIIQVKNSVKDRTFYDNPS